MSTQIGTGIAALSSLKDRRIDASLFMGMAVDYHGSSRICVKMRWSFCEGRDVIIEGMRLRMQ